VTPPVERRRQSWREFRLAYPGIISVLLVLLMSMLAMCACSSPSSAPDDTHVASTVVVQVTNDFPRDFFGVWSDSLTVAAFVSDPAGNAVNGLPVRWRLESANGTAIADTTANVITTGAQTATVVFHRRALVGIVARVNDGTPAERTGSLFVSW